MTLTLLPVTVVEDRGDWIIAVNANQDLLGKTMLVLRRPCTSVVDVRSGEWESLHDQIRRVVEALDRLFQPDQVNLAFLMNKDAQVHLHVIPRYASPRQWSGSEFVDHHWGHAFGHEQQRANEPLLNLLAEAIRGELASPGHLEAQRR